MIKIIIASFLAVIKVAAVIILASGIAYFTGNLNDFAINTLLYAFCILAWIVLFDIRDGELPK